MIRIDWFGKTLKWSLNPWKFGAITSLVALGGFLLVCLGITLAFGWFLLLALIIQKLWNFIFSNELTQQIFGASELSYLKALAMVGILYIASTIFSKKE